MNIDDSQLIARFQGLITEMLVERRLGERRPELTDELYQTWREVEQRGLKETPEYRDVLLRAGRHALWLAGLVRLAAPPISPPEAERIDTLDASQKWVPYGASSAAPYGIAASSYAIACERDCQGGNTVPVGPLRPPARGPA
jgi:hypothetical protein